MRVAAVSGDLLVKLAVAGVAVIALATVVRKAVSVLPDHVPDAIDPTSPNNVAASTVNALGHAVATADGAGSNADGSWSLGAAVFDMLHPATSAAVRAASGPVAPDQNASNPLEVGGVNYGLF